MPWTCANRAETAPIKGNRFWENLIVRLSSNGGEESDLAGRFQGLR